MSGPFQQTINEFRNDISGETVSVEKMLVALNNRGFGALLLIPCLIELLPTGVIPGVPSLCATMIILLTVQMAFGRRYPWLPQRLKNITVNRHKLEKGLDKAQPYIGWVDRQSRERLRFWVSYTGERLAAFLIIALALTIYPLEFIPFASSIPAFTIALFAIGIITKDGIIMMSAWILSLTAIIGITALIYNYLL